MSKKLLILLWSTFIAVGFVSARQLTPSEALARLTGSGIHATKARRVASQLRLAYTSDHDFGTSYYVYNNGSTGGFYILGADDTMPAVLGYTDKGAFSYSTIPSNMKWFLGRYDLMAQQCIKYGASATTRSSEEDYEPIEPLLGDIEWDQTTPYNDLCPVYEGDRGLTGCVATAMAQVMKYWEWPLEGKGTRSYDFDFDIDGEYIAEMSIKNYSFAHKLDWANMLDSYSGRYTTAQGKAVATLMKDCGVAAKMAYGAEAAGGSGALSEDAMAGMIKYLSYDKGMQLVYQENFDQDEWDELIYTELWEERPVIFGGNGEDGNGGHEFVCDGYAEEGYFHINWGWSGSCNGYYIINGEGLVPEETGSGGAEAGDSYGYALEAIIGIQPDGYDDDAIHGIDCIANDNATVYNLMGLRLQKAQKGLNIIGGKKVLVP